MDTECMMADVKWRSIEKIKITIIVKGYLQACFQEKLKIDFSHNQNNRQTLKGFYDLSSQ